ncbi:hypothetical protein GI374_17030 [Paracoccus sp. S-4012]|uniref:hypothetical protein n=1 Tax=Paracoccus sp. S-4012 TaxID=2665648 RepID=UPI0012AF848C|nr:hypothetical protein [Paracoccus sp. S-4012]MRX52083.1 hypothetical protein [Paracoccus sp. S-4012]
MEVTLEQGQVAARIDDGAVTRLAAHGVEVLRGLACILRDADWGTYAAEDVQDEVGATGFIRRCRYAGGAVEGEVRFTVTAGGLDAEARLICHAPLDVNRAGFVVLHPLSGVEGAPLTVRHPDGSTEETRFPQEIAPAQPVRDIAGLAHEVHGVPVEISFKGEVFEMEDQRNWTDASFKTYCRPLSLPRPFMLRPGEVIRQRVRVAVGARRAAGQTGAGAAAVPARFPAIALAAEPAWGPAPDAGTLAGSGARMLQARVGVGEWDDWLAAAAWAADAAGLGLAVELVGDPGDAPRLAAVLATSGVRPRRVSGIAPAWLASRQPEEPCPPGPGPADFARALRAAFPDATAATGLYTCFTELNRSRPDPSHGDVVSHGTAAIVHDASDAAVLQTAEALPAVFASSRRIAGDRPLALNLCAIGMRSNPYGAALRPNPQGQRLTMTDRDPRQGTDFAAAFAVAAYAAAAQAGAEEIALAAPSGPFAAQGPLADAIRALAAVAAGTPRALPVTAPDITGIASDRGAVLANTGEAPTTVAGRSLPPGQWLVLDEAFA